MRRHIKTLAVIFSVALNLAFLVGYGVRRFSDRPRFAYEDLDLSEDQRVRIEAGRDRFLSALNDIGDRIIAKHLELMDLIAAEPTDRQAVEGKFQEIHSLQQSMQSNVMEHLLEDKQILTPEQRAKFFALLKSRIRAQVAPGPPWLPAGARERKK
jgi:Spy/CpxP family protein refolding chaperone